MRVDHGGYGVRRIVKAIDKLKAQRQAQGQNQKENGTRRSVFKHDGSVNIRSGRLPLGASLFRFAMNLSCVGNNAAT